MTGKKQLPNDLFPDADERFNRLLKAMVGVSEAEVACGNPLGGSETSGEASDEGCDDTQTPKDTSEDAS